MVAADNSTEVQVNVTTHNPLIAICPSTRTNNLKFTLTILHIDYYYYMIKRIHTFIYVINIHMYVCNYMNDSLMRTLYVNPLTPNGILYTRRLKFFFSTVFTRKSINVYFRVDKDNFKTNVEVINIK